MMNGKNFSIWPQASHSREYSFRSLDRSGWASERESTTKRSTLTLLLALSLFPIACVSNRSQVATKFGYEKSSKVQVGSYDLHYGRSGSNELVLLSEGNLNIFSRATGHGTDVFLDGLPFIHFDRNHDGSLTNFFLDVPDTNGRPRFTLIDRDADGQWDLKIDHVLKKSFVWKEGQWNER
jgi:hypothetical protein